MKICSGLRCDRILYNGQILSKQPPPALPYPNLPWLLSAMMMLAIKRWPPLTFFDLNCAAPCATRRCNTNYHKKTLCVALRDYLLEIHRGGGGGCAAHLHRVVVVVVVVHLIRERLAGQRENCSPFVTTTASQLGTINSLSAFYWRISSNNKKPIWNDFFYQ